MISIVVPLYNEQESLVELTNQTAAVFKGIGRDFEIIFIDDGSNDASGQILAALQAQYGFVRVLKFRMNCGKAAALDAGFKAARGEIIITMDADLQDDPNEIPRFLAELEKGNDLVNGWKEKRRDPLHKTLPSMVFNYLVRKFTGVYLKDINCGMKAYKRNVIEQLHLYGEMHRFIPVLVYWHGFKITEISINHRPRKFGKSKYGIKRFVNGILDLMTIQLNTRFFYKPLHFFGRIGLLFGIIGTVILMYLAIIWALDMGPIGTRPLFMVGIFFSLAGLQIIGIGLLAELIIRNIKQSESAKTEIKNYDYKQLSEVSNL